MSDTKQFQQASQDFAADLSALRDDIAKLTGSVAHLLRSRASSSTDQAYNAFNQTRDTLADRAGDLREQFNSRANDVRDHLSNRAADAQERLGAFSSDVETKIERNPLTAVVVAAIAGLLMGTAEPFVLMFAIVAGLLGDALAPLLDTVATTSARLLRKVALFLVAALCMVVVLIALTIAFGLWIATLAGPIVAALSVAGVYLLVTVVAVILALGDGKAKSKARPSAETTRSGPKPEPKESPAARAAIDAQIDQITAPLIDILQRFGLKREQLAVFAGASVAKRLGPLPLVGCAIVAGFLIGRLWKSWRHVLETALVALPMVADILGQPPAEPPKAEA